MSSLSATSKKTRIESLVSMGRSTWSIMAEVGATESYVLAVARTFKAYSPQWHVTPDSDDELHLNQIHASNNGMGFPSYAKVPL